MNVQKAKETVKKIVHFIGVFLFGVVSAILLGSRLRNHGIGAGTDRGEREENTGSLEECNERLDGIEGGIDECEGGLEGIEEQLGEIESASTSTIGILEKVRARKRTPD